MNTENISSNGQPRVVKKFDVRSLPCPQRREMVFGAFDELKPGEAFIFTNDHDPKPLCMQIKAVSNEPFRWEYLKLEQGEVTVKVSKDKP